MRAFRKVLKPAHAGLRAAAARAEQFPSHRHRALPRRRQKQLDRMVGRGGPERCECDGPNAAQIDDRRVPQVVDEVRRKRMRSKIAREFRAKRIESLAGGGLSLILDPPARDERGTVALANDPLDPATALPYSASKRPACFPTKPKKPAGSARPVTISRHPSPSATSSQPHSHRRIGPFW